MTQQIHVTIADLNAAWDLLRHARLSQAEQLWFADWQARVAYELQVAQLPKAPPTGKEEESGTDPTPDVPGGDEQSSTDIRSDYPSADGGITSDGATNPDAGTDPNANGTQTHRADATLDTDPTDTSGTDNPTG